MANKTKGILSLPPEVLRMLPALLCDNPLDLVALKKTCKSLRDAVNAEIQWETITKLRQTIGSDNDVCEALLAGARRSGFKLHSFVMPFPPTHRRGVGFATTYGLPPVGQCCVEELSEDYSPAAFVCLQSTWNHFYDQRNATQRLEYVMHAEVPLMKPSEFLDVVRRSLAVWQNKNANPMGLARTMLHRNLIGLMEPEDMKSLILSSKMFWEPGWLLLYHMAF